jgi:hypothetical protein
MYHVESMGRNLMFRPHALTRLEERGVLVEDVAAVLAAPRFVRPSAEYPHRDEVYGEARGRTLKVVVVRGSNPVYVVTVHRFTPDRLRRLMAREGHR